MNNEQAISIFEQIKKLYEKHINHFGVNAYLIDENLIESLFLQLDSIDLHQVVDDSEWKERCSELYQLNIQLREIASRKQMDMSRARHKNYSLKGYTDSYYFDKKG